MDTFKKVDGDRTATSALIESFKRLSEEELANLIPIMQDMLVLESRKTLGNVIGVMPKDK